MDINSMIETIKMYGIKNKIILDAMKKIDRALFVPEKEYAYADSPLSIGYDQTISQPYTVAFMLDNLELKEGQNVLEIGCGSGYNAVLIKEIIGEKGKITSIEIVKGLIEKAKSNIKKTRKDVNIVFGDGSLGYEKEQPYDRIICTAACPSIPKPWIKQLKDNGIIIAPVGTFSQEMMKIVKTKNKISEKRLGSFRFVPLKGKHGY